MEEAMSKAAFSEPRKTNRGFQVVEFADFNGVKCSLQQSSLATEDALWLGCNDADPKVLVKGQGWQSVEMPEGYTANTRMHLSRKQVKKLIGYLEQWHDTGGFK